MKQIEIYESDDGKSEINSKACKDLAEIVSRYSQTFLWLRTAVL